MSKKKFSHDDLAEILINILLFALFITIGFTALAVIIF